MLCHLVDINNIRNSSKNLLRKVPRKQSQVRRVYQHERWGKKKGFAFHSGKPLYIMYVIDDEQTRKAVSERRAILLRNKSIRYDRRDNFLQLHITLFHCQINTRHPDSNIFETEEFRERIRKAFNKILLIKT